MDIESPSVQSQFRPKQIVVFLADQQAAALFAKVIKASRTKVMELGYYTALVQNVAQLNKIPDSYLIEGLVAVGRNSTKVAFEGLLESRGNQAQPEDHSTSEVSDTFEAMFQTELKKLRDSSPHIHVGPEAQITKKVPTLVTISAGSSPAADAFAYNPKHKPVLCIYGGSDRPLTNATIFSNKAKGYHKLELIDNAGYEFDGFEDQASTLVETWFDQDARVDRFYVQTLNIATIPRWPNVEGIANFRDIGGYTVASGGRRVRPGVVYRCANTAGVTEAGIDEMKRLNIKTVFDFRSAGEREKAGIPVIPGIEVRHTPIFGNEDLSPAALAVRYQNFFDPLEGFEKAYEEILEKGGGAYKQIFEHIRDRPNDGLVVHCTAGKDRTGVICMLILLLAGVDKDTVAREYELTTLGLRAELPRIARTVTATELSLVDKKGITSLMSSRYEAMMGSIAMLENKFGGAAKWVKDHCDMTDEDVAKIARNITERGGYKWVSSL